MITRRREFLVAGAVLGLSGVACGAEKPAAGEDVSALEDLMREHGVLSRILLIYEEAIRSLRAKPATAIPFRNLQGSGCAGAEVRRRIPREAGRELHLPGVRETRQTRPVGEGAQGATCRRSRADRHDSQSRAGEGSSPKPKRKPGDRLRGVHPHVSSPQGPRRHRALSRLAKDSVGQAKLDELGDKFEEEENRRFGAEGFEKIVEQVAAQMFR